MSGNCAAAWREDASNAAKGSGIRALCPAHDHPDPPPSTTSNLYPPSTPRYDVSQWRFFGDIECCEKKKGHSLQGECPSLEY